MPNNSNLHNKNSSPADDRESFWQGLFSDKWGMLLPAGGLLFILCNVGIFEGVDLRPSTWLFYLNMRLWSIHTAIILWIAAIWLTTELTDMAGNYLPSIRISAVIGILLVIIFGLQSFLSIQSPSVQGHSIWVSVITVVLVCCAVRSLWLLYDYRYAGAEFVDLEEARWFWAMSGFLFAGIIIFLAMLIIPVRTPIHVQFDVYLTESLFTSCCKGFSRLFQLGHGSFALQAFGLLVFVAAVTFVYVVGKWALTFLSKFKERWG